MPNTKVYLKHALIPGVLSGVAMQLLQIFYINSQIWVSSYNAIYGSFAALPLFMLWLQISWTICLFGAELTYTNQNLEQYAFRASTDQLSHRYKLMLSAVIMQKICKRFDKGEPAYTALQLKLETNIPIRIMHDLLYDLCQEHLLTEVNSDEKGEESVYQPAESINRLSVGVLIDRLEARGHWNLDINTLPIKSKHWKTLIANRSTYLANQRELLLKDL